MSPRAGSHNYTPLAPLDDEQQVISTDKQSESLTNTLTSPSRPLHNHRTQIAIITLLAFLAGVFLPPVANSLITTLTTGPDETHAHRLHNLFSFPSEMQTFLPDENFTLPASPETDKVWMELLGPSRGFIALEHPEKTYGLPPGRARPGNDDRQVYGVSMFHQLHCLMMIRNIYYNALQQTPNTSTTDDSHHTSGMSDSEAAFAIEHTEHCFDYLQQSIRCAGLMQIEVPHGSRNNIFDGYGTEHTCASWTSIVDFMDRYQVGK